MQKPEYKIDGLACSDLQATVAEFNRVFGQWWGGDYWDGHLDVFNDILDWVEDFKQYALVWSSSEAARQQLGHPVMAAWLEQKLSQCRPGYGDDWRKQLADAQRGRGQTMFDVLVEIISDHEQIELRLE